MIYFLNTVFDIFTFLCGMYIMVGSVCRMDRLNKAASNMWRGIYVLVFAIAAFMTYDLMVSVLEIRDCVILITVAAYIHLTAKSWAKSVPLIALKQ